MSKVRISKSGWPVGNPLGLIPGGTVLDLDDFQYLNTALPWPPPRDAIALDQGAFDKLVEIYGPYFEPSCDRSGPHPWEKPR
jgi:hypothetical protein